MNYSELDEDDEDLYEGLEAEDLDSFEKKVEEKTVGIEKAAKPKEQLYEKSRNNLYKKLGAKTAYTKKESCLFFGAPQAIEDIDVGDYKVEFFLIFNLPHFINDILIKNVCDKVGKVKRVLILEDENYCKSLGLCLVEFYYLENSQNFSAYLKEKFKAEVKKLDYNIEEQIKKDELYNYGGYLDNTIIEQIKKENLQNIENLNDTLYKPLNLNKHPLFTWFNTDLASVLDTYVKLELKKKKKSYLNNEYIDKQNDSNSDSESDISTHILNYAYKKNRLISHKT